MNRILLAYVDPGTGSLLWQVLLSGFFVFLFMLRRVREKIKSAYASLRHRNVND